MRREDLIRKFRKLLFKNNILWIFLIVTNLIQFVTMINIWNKTTNDLDFYKSKSRYFEYVNDSLTSELKSVQPTIINFPISSPIKDYQISSLYGFRVDPIDSIIGFHGGVDLVSSTENDTVYASASGKVIKSEYHTEYGNMVIIQHKSGFSTLYGHLSKVIIDNGCKINLLQPIGIIGETGRATGIHLHYEIMFNEDRINPRYLIYN